MAEGTMAERSLKLFETGSTPGMKFVFRLVLAISVILGCSAEFLELKDKKVKVFIEADVPKNLDVLRMEYKFHPKCNESGEDRGDAYHDCRDVPVTTGSGVYNITVNKKPKEVYCEINPDGSKYLVIQRRVNGSQDFYKTWEEYEIGFGDLHHEFWIGNAVLHQLTTQEKYKLRIEMEAFDTTKVHAEFSTFVVGSPKVKYRLLIGGYNGDAGDSLYYHNGRNFSTHDQDNDKDSRNCAVVFKGAWWYKNCHHSNLNGKYLGGHHDSYGDGINWRTFKGDYESLKMVTMKIYR